jgi:hypothetical protein
MYILPVQLFTPNDCSLCRASSGAPGNSSNSASGSDSSAVCMTYIPVTAAGSTQHGANSSSSSSTSSGNSSSSGKSNSSGSRLFKGLMDPSPRCAHLRTATDAVSSAAGILMTSAQPAAAAASKAVLNEARMDSSGAPPVLWLMPQQQQQSGSSSSSYKNNGLCSNGYPPSTAPMPVLHSPLVARHKLRLKSAYAQQVHVCINCPCT